MVNYQHHVLPGGAYVFMLCQCSEDNFSMSLWKASAKNPEWSILLEGYTEKEAQRLFLAGLQRSGQRIKSLRHHVLWGITHKTS